MSTISMDKAYRTRDGREVRIYALDGSPAWPVHGAVKDDRGWIATCWNVDGSVYSDAPNGYDLIEVKPEEGEGL